MVRRSIVALLLFSCVWLVQGQVLEAQSTIENPNVKQAPKPAAEVLDDVAEQDQESAADADASAASTVPPSEMLLPSSTKAWISIPDANELERRFESTQFGRLLEKESLKPFADNIEAQVKQWVNDQNVRLSLDVDDLHGVHSGEICFAGVLPEDNAGEPIPGSHGLVFLMDVSKTVDRAKELQVKISAELVNQGATQEQGTINGVAYIKSTIDKPQVFRKKRFNFQAIVNDRWMLVTNNEVVFRTMIANLIAPEKLAPAQTLAGREAFKAVMENSAFEQYPAHIRWFVDPFGYVTLAQQIRDDEALSKVPRDNWPKDLEANGFDALKGTGGSVSVATGEHEILHRTFTYAKQQPQANTAPFDLFDFNVNKELPLEVPSWVPEDANSVVMGNWDFERALKGVATVFDAVIGEEKGDFERTLDDLKQDPNLQLNVRKLVSLMENRLVIVSASEEPIDKESERVVAGIRIKGESQYVLDSIKRSHPNARVIKLGDASVVEIDTTIEPELDDELPDDFFDDEFVDDEPVEEQERFELFEKRYFGIAKTKDADQQEVLYVLVSNNKNYLRSVIERTETKLPQMQDYQQVSQALAKLESMEQANWKTFGRLDQSLQINYETLRRGEMAQSQTVLARLLNQAAAQRRAEQARLDGVEVNPDEVRQQKLDGGKLPEDYDQEIAPFLGPAGSVLVSTDDGWRVTGCLLKKKEMDVVQKPAEVDSSDNR